MRKEQLRKDPRVPSLTPKQDDNTSKSLELSEGQLEAHFQRLNLAHTRRIYKGRILYQRLAPSVFPLELSTVNPQLPTVSSYLHTGTLPPTYLLCLPLLLRK
jgi:hypothetical protein